VKCYRARKLTWILPLLACAISMAQQGQQNTPSVAIARWPQDRAAAISLTFDDGLDTQLDIVGPTLKKHHLHGTFYVATGLGPWEKRKQDWKLLAQDGNELGFHTVHHPCLLEQIEPHAQNYTPEMMEAEIRESASAVGQAANTVRGLTFAYPCGDLSFGPPGEQARNSALYLRYVSEHAIGARIVGPGGPQDPDDLSVLTITDLGPTEGKRLSGLLALAEPAIRQGQWGVFCFHGVGGDYLAVTAESLDELASHFERHSEVWTATFGDVLRYTQERKAAGIEVKTNCDRSIDVSLQWPLDPKIYDLPLTLKIQPAEIWTGAIATADGKVLSVTMAAGSATVMLVEVAPQTKVVHVGQRRR
jgi:peptidoglycan/xylan/chitin deacetylase (PgdA/CDA1 family)